MKITVTHSTVYRYDFPVHPEPHILWLRPRTNSSQRLPAFEIQITPTPAGTTECLDQDGTLALNAWFVTPTSEAAGWNSGGPRSQMEASLNLQVGVAA